MNDIMSWWRGRPPLRFATRTFTPVGLATNWPASGDNGLAASFQLRWNLYLYQPVFCPTVGVHFKEQEYLERFPHLSEQLKLQMEFHRALQEIPIASETQDVPENSSSLHIGRVMAKMKMHHSRTLGEEAFTGTYKPAPVEAEGTLIANRYKLRQQIGEGGMGTVWMADQTEPIKRKVAVKLIRVERNQSKTILARFEAERQAIALMDHPNIAKLLDAGTTGGGAPFFVMELVKGIPLNDFCDQHRLTISERLNLFMQICLAVQHAHQKGIIHRDLKPGNILIESHDGKPVPKIIDFGLAKATSSLQLTEHSLYTAFGSVMGTPAYMAPEQATFNAVDVDTRADVYALGVILYELLTGTTPITRESLNKAALDEMLRLVREQEAPTPSNRLSSNESTPSVAACRQIEPQKLGRFVKGELDWIVMKALSKERDRRYETANGFAEDIERFLNHEPVQAGPPNASYRFLKFVQRHRGEVLAASLVLLALVAGVVGTTWGWLEAKAQEREASAARDREIDQRRKAVRERDEKEKARQQAVAEKIRADREKDIAEAVQSFLNKDVLGTTPYNQAGRNDITVIEAVNRAALKVGEKFKGKPMVEAQVRTQLGWTYSDFSEWNRSAEQFQKAIAIYRDLGVSESDPRYLQTISFLPWVTLQGGKVQEARILFADALARCERALPESNSERQSVLNHYAFCLFRCGDYAEAEKMFEAALSAHRKSSPTRSPYMLLNNFALLRKRQGNFQEAEKMLRTTLEEHRKVFGNNHPDTILLLKNLGDTYMYFNRYEQAIAPLRESLDLEQSVFGETRPSRLLGQWKSLGRALVEVGLWSEARDIYRKNLNLSRKSNEADVNEALALLGSSLLLTKEWREAQVVLKEYAERQEKQFPDKWQTFNAYSMLGEALVGQEKYADSGPLLVKGYDGLKVREETLPPEANSRIPRALDRLIKFYTATNKPDEVKRYQALRAKYTTAKEPANKLKEKK
jgi:serine/threonine protein kinase/Tfp pilus assembly protein PilF